MKFLEDKILECGRVLPGHVLKVDAFLNHQIDVGVINKLGEEFYNSFKDDGVTKILTVEASGIAIACAAASFFNVPVVFAKKGQHSNTDTDFYSADVFSYTKGKKYSIQVSKEYLSPSDNVLIIDDFLANGEASFGMKKLIEDAGARLAGIGIAIEKGFQPGGKMLREQGIKLVSLAIVESMTDSSLSFRHDG